MALERARELQLSKRGEAAHPGTAAAAGGYPVMVATHAALFVAPPLELWLRPRRRRWTAAWIGLEGGATALRWWCIRSLGEYWNVRAAVPDQLRPVTSGPYRWVRHPNYLAVGLEFLALPMAGGAWASALCLSLLDGLILAQRIRAEERLLELVPQYRRAFAGRRRFIPGVL